MDITPHEKEARISGMNTAINIKPLISAAWVVILRTDVLPGKFSGPLSQDPNR